MGHERLKQKKMMRYLDAQGAPCGVRVENIDAIWAVRPGDTYDGVVYARGTVACIHTSESCLESSEETSVLLDRWERMVTGV